ncbi:MAG TPA: hypothetical protein VGM18_04805 [Candidatus Sulfotelmatobacter sp.]|jgi:hypothetical protein
MPARQTAPCFRCLEVVEINVAAIVVDIRLRVVGVDDAVRSSQASVSICMTCADLISKGDAPNQKTQPLNYIVYERAREIFSADPSFTFLSWIEMRKAQGLPVPAMSDTKILKAWNDFRRVMALPNAPTLDQSDPESAHAKRLAS